MKPGWEGENRIVTEAFTQDSMQKLAVIMWYGKLRLVKPVVHAHPHSIPGSMAVQYFQG